MAIADTPEVFLAPSDVAERLQLDPSAPIRWMRRGVLLADGSRLCLKHVRLPGSFRTTQAWLDAFLQAIADDRAGKVNPAPKTTVNTARVERMHAGLAAAGYTR